MTSSRIESRGWDLSKTAWFFVDCQQPYSISDDMEHSLHLATEYFSKEEPFWFLTTLEMELLRPTKYSPVCTAGWRFHARFESERLAFVSCIACSKHLNVYERSPILFERTAAFVGQKNRGRSRARWQTRLWELSSVATHMINIRARSMPLLAWTKSEATSKAATMGVHEDRNSTHNFFSRVDTVSLGLSTSLVLLVFGKIALLHQMTHRICRHFALVHTVWPTLPHSSAVASALRLKISSTAVFTHTRHSSNDIPGDFRHGSATNLPHPNPPRISSMRRSLAVIQQCLVV